MSGLAALLEADAERLVALWIERLRLGIAPEGKNEPELRDHIPSLMGELCVALRRGEPPDHSAAAEIHGRQRYALGFDVEAVVREYSALRNVIFDASEQAGLHLSLHEVRVLSDFIANAVGDGVSEYTGHRVEAERAHAAEEHRVRDTRESDRQALYQAAQEARDEAQTAREKLDSVFTQSPVGIAIVEGDEHVYSYANPAYLALVANREVLGKPLLEAVPEIRGQGFDTLFRSVMTSGAPVYGKAQPAVLLLEGEAHTRWFNYVFSPLRAASGQIYGVMQCAFDVTEQVLSHQRTEALLTQLGESEDRLRQVLDFEQQLIGIASHDLRTPLHVMLLASARLAQHEELSAAATKHVVRIHNAAERAIAMVADLLDFTQARLGGGLVIEPRRSNFHELVGNVMEDMETTFPDRELRFESEGDGTGEWDPERIVQVVQNLVTNALKFSPKQTRVEVSAQVLADSVVLRVHNQGAPIPEAKRSVLFEPFQRAVGRLDKDSRSVGLGLYIVKQIVSAHHGSVEVSSSDQGTTFTVTLPRITRTVA